MGVLKRDLAEYLYNRLPKIYRSTDDEEILKKFIDIFVEGGYNPLLEEASKIMDLLDVDKCPSRFLPLLCKMYGYEYTLEIPELFQRRLLKYIVDMYKRKGTKSVVRFIARELTGFESEIIENKDFDEELIELTKWDKRFEHYRNFVLKLTAPMEDSSLYNKENIVVKIVNDFIPTNSQVFVITAYWFKEESFIAKGAFYDMTEYLEDFKGDFKVNAVVCTTETEVIQYINNKMYVESHRIFGEEISRLNSLPVPLHTNALLKMNDIIKFKPHHYSKFLKAFYSNDIKLIRRYEGYIRNSINEYLESIDTHRIKEKKILEVNPLNNYGFTKHDTIYTLKYEDSKSIRVVSREYDKYYRVKDTNILEVLEKSKMKDILVSQRLTDFGLMDSKTFGDDLSDIKLDIIIANTRYSTYIRKINILSEILQLNEYIKSHEFMGEIDDSFLYEYLKLKTSTSYINAIKIGELDKIQFDTIVHNVILKLSESLDKLRNKIVDNMSYNNAISLDSIKEIHKNICEDIITFDRFLVKISDKLVLNTVVENFISKINNDFKDITKYLDSYILNNSITFTETHFKLYEYFNLYTHYLVKTYNNLDFIKFVVPNEIISLYGNSHYLIQNSISEVLECMYINGTISKKCDIIKTSRENYIHTTPFKERGDNSKLNVNLNLYTNGLNCFDIITEQGKPPKLIIL